MAVSFDGFHQEQNEGNVSSVRVGFVVVELFSEIRPRESPFCTGEGANNTPSQGGTTHADGQLSL